MVQLTYKGVPFHFGETQCTTQEDLKQALLTLPALKPINYTSEVLVILMVDTSQLMVDFYLCQANLKKPKAHYFSCFSSILLNNQECHFSQPKLELYRLYQALRAYKIYLVGVCNLIIKVDARYIKGMLNNPDVAP